MEEKIIALLSENARMGMDELAARAGTTEKNAAKIIAGLEKRGVICGYTAILNEDELAKSDRIVKALIEVKITPRRDGGFDSVARRIARFPEVTDVLLISGGFDLLLTVEGRSLQEVASFVAAKLSTIDGVISCNTGFMLKKYKESGRIMQCDEDYERLKVTP